MSAEPIEGGGDTRTLLCPVCCEDEHHVVDCPKLEDGSLLAFWRYPNAQDATLARRAGPSHVAASGDCDFCFSRPARPGSHLCASCVDFFERNGVTAAEADRACYDEVDGYFIPAIDPPRPSFDAFRAACGPFVPQPGDSVAVEPRCDLHPPSREWRWVDESEYLAIRGSHLGKPWLHRRPRRLHSRRARRGSLGAVRKSWVRALVDALAVWGGMT